MGALRRPRLRRLRMAQIKIEPQQGGWPRNFFGVSPPLRLNEANCYSLAI